MTPDQVIKAAVPEASSDFCDYVLWSRTPFPGKINAQKLYKAASRASRAQKNSIRLCDFCDNQVFDSFCCVKCSNALKQH